MSLDIKYNGIPFYTRQPNVEYALSSDVANTYATSGAAAGLTSSYVANTYVLSSYGSTHALSSDVAAVYATSSVVDELPTSSEIADTYATSALADTFAISSDVADTYATSSQLALRVKGGAVYIYSDSGDVYNSSEVEHLIGGTPGSVVLTYGVPIGSGVETLWASDLTDSSFWINIGTPHETSSTIYWMAYRSA